MTHLLFRDKLATAELYELDVHALRQQTNAAVLIGLSTLMRNFGVLLGELPTSVFLKCGLDFDRMYPEPRHLIGALRLQATYRRDRPHLRRALASVRERYGVRSGPLDFSAGHLGGSVRA